MANPLLIGAALGLGKSVLVDRPREQRQRQLAAQTALYSPWTGMIRGIQNLTIEISGDIIIHL